MKIAAFSKSYGSRTVITLESLSLSEGKIYGVIGANGSGKSTLAKVLAGIIKPDSGTAPLEEGISVGYMPQKSYAYRMKLISNLLLAKPDKLRARALMEGLNLTALAGARADRLSGGETARMAMARLMMKRFELLILDEPTASMDMESTILAERQIKKYCSETGCTVILVTHSIQQARRLADEILFFSSGVLTESGPVSSVLDNPRKEETKRFLEFYGI